MGGIYVWVPDDFENEAEGGYNRGFQNFLPIEN